MTSMVPAQAKCSSSTCGTFRPETHTFFDHCDSGLPLPLATGNWKLEKWKNYWKLETGKEGKKKTMNFRWTLNFIELNQRNEFHIHICGLADHRSKTIACAAQVFWPWLMAHLTFSSRLSAIMYEIKPSHCCWMMCGVHLIIKIHWALSLEPWLLASQWFQACWHAISQIAWNLGSFQRGQGLGLGVQPPWTTDDMMSWHKHKLKYFSQCLWLSLCYSDRHRRQTTDDRCKVLWCCGAFSSQESKPLLDSIWFRPISLYKFLVDLSQFESLELEFITSRLSLYSTQLNSVPFWLFIELFIGNVELIKLNW